VGHCFAQRRFEVCAGLFGGPRQQLVVDAAPRHRGDADDVLSCRRQLLEAGHEDVGERSRQRSRVELSEQVRCVQELLGVVGVALGAVEDPSHGHLVDRRSVQGGEVVAHLGGVERQQVEPLGDRKPHELRQQRPQRVPAVQVVGAVTADEEKSLLTHPSEQEGDEVTRRLVGPMQVLEHQQRRPRPFVACPGEHACDGVE
jgi:hypothetical protein